MQKTGKKYFSLLKSHTYGNLAQFSLKKPSSEYISVGVPENRTSPHINRTSPHITPHITTHQPHITRNQDIEA